MSRHGFHTFTMPEAPVWGFEPDPFYEMADRAATRPCDSRRESRLSSHRPAPDTLTKGAEHGNRY